MAAAAPAPAPAPPPARLTIYCIGTLDTKGQELLYVAQQVSSNLNLFFPAAQGQVEVVTVDVSSSQAAVVEPESGHSHVSRQHVLSCHPDASLRSSTSLPSDRGAAVSVLSAALREFLRTEGGVAGAIGIGGSGGTALIAPALRELPIGVPKILVSTVASGNADAFVQGSDLVLWPSVVDLSGLNTFSSRILNNAASALAGMVAGIISNKLYGNQSGSGAGRPTVGLTMFGVTTPCVNAVQTKLREAGFESLVFHATGTGGQVMENMVTQGLLQGVIDVTTTEVADYVVGGVMPCKSNRFEAMIQMGVPLVVSVGALDMVNFWERNSIPAEFSTRQFHVHNEKVTVMRTTVEENKKFANFIADALNKSSAPVRVLLPDHGVSALDASDMPFYDPEAREALYNQLQQAVSQTADRQIQRKPLHINDQDFAEALVQEFLAIASESSDIQVPSSEGPLNVKNEQETASMSSGIDAAQTVHKLPDQGATTDGCTVQQHSLSFDVIKAEDSSRHVKCGDTSLPRSLVLQRLRGQISRGIPIIGAGAGTGISAKFEEEGGADLIILYNSGRFRMAGRGSLAGLMPYKDANAVLVDMASEVLPVVKKVPVLAGVCASDPFRQIRIFLRQLADMGFAGVQNFPTVGLIDGNFRQNLEETGMGYGLEVDMIRQAHDLGLLTTPYAFNETESRQMASAGADIIVAHMGLTTTGSIGAKTAISLEESARRVKAIAVAAQEIKPDILVLCHGGPISGPEEAAFVIQKSGVHGFYGASSMERLPVETAIISTMRKFKQVKLR